MSKIEQNKEKKRQAILKAAKAVFWAEGFTLASMDVIASEAQMTKQTLYRYFSSKDVLFKATLQQMGAQFDEHSVEQLKISDNYQALYGFAKAFLAFHLSDEHIATLKLLIAENGKSPTILESFMSVGENETDIALAQFFTDRFDIEDVATKVTLWTGMLLSLRSGVLMGMAKPNLQDIEQHARASTEFLLAALNTD
ncbi:TetR family transcriptional regulator [Vibrio lentus]|uniref:TetR/AcrR family transcriptional regulator n=1 Tax=Vibrio lentus TaxID=136468 RepID=UPI000C83AAB5|nr:TetR/AcrR family transcriptional regulator [Vibrio lentus]PMI39208.1 TetR family transcriptional regulator [Vibrio lentus]PMI63841.1 TetR family transcriptional regulator [Vibrio lentus]PMJ50629.1 TetR family transcriptional regulator [Vibrio lentus]PML47563.1 TetR family transcriptional regulator [Vibrio lentus]PMN06876.1 TetR family transcriptional regulator [Vibrio lentus]